MDIRYKEIGSLYKVRDESAFDMPRFDVKTVMKGEFFSYQIAISSISAKELYVTVDSPIKDHLKLYAVKNVIVDFPTYPTADDEYITKAPGIMPDLLVPLSLEDGIIKTANDTTALWVSVSIPDDIDAGEYKIVINLNTAADPDDKITSVFTVNITDKKIMPQSTIFTEWFHTDSIADIHNVPVYSEKHWELIDKYMSLAHDIGINLILTPVITPPLDTAKGTKRTCTQLVGIEFDGKKYSFDFSLLERWIGLCRKNGIFRYEISHLFSQWGLGYAPNIKVTENGREYYKFGWHVTSDSEEYKDFLSQFLPSLTQYLEDKGILDDCWFHISDEPHLSHLETYKYAYNLVKPLIKGAKNIDAISNFEFYEKGLIEYPVTATSEIDGFLCHEVPHQWVYYCCGQHSRVGNRYIAQESYKNRILGLQMYKYNIEGFLQWGYNFYYNQLSRRLINPYVTTSADKAFPSGDPFSVYPIENGAAPSLRALVFKEALNDIEVCKTLESLIGRDAVIALIDSEAGMDLTFAEYPRNNEFIPSLIEKMELLIKKHL